MTDSIYNNAGMPSEQPKQVPCSECDGEGGFDGVDGGPCSACGGTGVSRERPLPRDWKDAQIAALTLERDTLKAEIKEWKHSLESVALMAGMEASESWGTLDILTHVREMREANAALKAKVERLSAPVSEQDVTEVCKILGRAETNGEAFGIVASRILQFLAARASTPHPINDDEQRRKDAAWNDRAKARCVCGEMIAWYSGEYLHVAGRSKSCADGRLASPAHFLVGMPPAEPEWEKEA